MPKARSRQTGTDDTVRVDRLLGLLGDLSKQGPSPALRERFGSLVAERHTRHAVDDKRRRGTAHGPRGWLKFALAGAFLFAVGISTMIRTHFERRKPIGTEGAPKASSSVGSLDNKIRPAPAVRSSNESARKGHRLHPATTPSTGGQQMAIRLPYSNSAIQNGTDTVIRISMSQSELFSLGFPISATAQDRRVVADLTLGDDGLPRAISLPLPLEVIKEKK
jgi:hypothetical protein